MFQPKSPNNLMFYCSIAVFILMLIIGTIQATVKTKPNPYFGLRISWTMQDPDVWNASQKIGGIALMIGAIVGILLTFFLKGSHPLALLAVLILDLLMVAAVSLGASYRIYKDKQDTNHSVSHSERGGQ